MAKRIDPKTVPSIIGCTYPPPHDAPCTNRQRQRLGNAAGLTDWHAFEDEFVLVIEGEVVLVTESGEEILRAADSAGFKAGVQDGHHLQNRSRQDAVVLEVGSRKPEDHGEYSDIDMRFVRADAGGGYVHTDGTPYPTR